jgi:hypothetical protein
VIYGLHIVPILVSSIICFALGALWFSPALFGNVWLKLLGKNHSEAAEHINVKTLLFVFLFIFAFNVGMEIIVDKAGVVGMNDGVKLGALIALAVSYTHTGIHLILERKPILLLAIYSGYYLVISVISASLMAMWR